MMLGPKNVSRTLVFVLVAVEQNKASDNTF